MQEKSITKNALLMSSKTMISLILPLITFPYISRILGADELGRYNFSCSIVSYFVLIAGLGVNTYAIREGTKVRDKEDEICNIYSEIYYINIISCVLSIVLLAIVLLVVPKLVPYRLLIAIIATQILFVTYGRSWIYNIFEEFGFITIVQLAFNILSLGAIFVFVKEPKDVNSYAIIQVISLVGSNIIYGIRINKYVHLKRVSFSSLKRHFKPILIIFGTSVATTIYVNSDITILGWLINDECVGIYSVSVKVYNIIKQVMVAVITVAIPRLTLYSNTEKFKPTFFRILNILLLISLPASTGLIMTSRDVVHIIAGKEYFNATMSLQFLSVALVFALVACLFGMGVLLPYLKERIFLYSTIASAVVNVVLNIFLIPIYEQNAAAFTTVVSQLIAFLICYKYSKEHISLSGEFKQLLNISVGCGCIVGTCLFIDLFNFPEVINLFVKICCSGVVYAIVLIVFKNVFFYEIIKKIYKSIIKIHNK